MGVKGGSRQRRGPLFHRLKGVNDPEAKRKIIGNLFIEIFDEESAKLANAKWLAQGTIYPDVIESAGSKTGKAHVIKSHHNVGGLPEHMKLGWSSRCANCSRTKCAAWASSSACRATMVYRHPFPGPGLGVRILGEVKPEYADLLAAPMPSSSTNCARPTCTTRPARPSPCSCRSNRSAWSATPAPTNG
jgi:GMP synthase (glutamine-hydrolysing)